MNIGERLKRIRVESGLTQQQLSELLKIGQTTIACYETGQREPHIFNLIAYADCFDCSVDYLLGRTDEFGNESLNTNANLLSDEERNMIKKFRNLDKSKKARILGYLDALVDS